VWFIALLELVLFIYKGKEFMYPQYAYGVEFFFIFVYPILDLSRLALLARGNRTERSLPLLLSLIFALPTIALHAYYLRYQTYTLRTEMIMHAIALSFVCAEFLLGSLSSWKIVQGRH
jgi:hypothetical protein